ncbi:MAG: hypothetical protein IT342_08950 [Candidatus Melainabacteria bacterium]|nr:hypothetical protein [Candidatus Melainabacteria bacterium]
MDINRLKRMTIGPIALLFIALVCAWNYKSDPRYLPPLHLQDLKTVDTTVTLSERGRYAVYYAFPLDVNVASNPFYVEDSMDKSPAVAETIKAVDATKVEVKDTGGSPIMAGKTTGRLLYKAEDPRAWIAGRPLVSFTNLRPARFQIHIEENKYLKSEKGKFLVGLLTRPDTTNGFQFLLSTFAIPAGMLVYLWALLASTAWGFLADKYKKSCVFSKLKQAGADATVGRVRMAMIPTQKMLFLETADGIHLALSGLARHLGFVPILIPWDKFSGAVRKDEFLDLKVSQPETTISMRANLLVEAEKKIRPHLQSESATAESSNAAASTDVEASQSAETSSAGAETTNPESQVLQPAEPLPRAQRAGLGIGLIMMGLLLAKFFIYDTLQMAHAKMAKVTVIDGIVCFAPFSMVVGVIILIHTLMNKTPDTTAPTGKSSFYWQMVGLAIALPILGFYIWFRFELSRLGYPFFGH